MAKSSFRSGGQVSPQAPVTQQRGQVSPQAPVSTTTPGVRPAEGGQVSPQAPTAPSPRPGKKG